MQVFISGFLGGVSPTLAMSAGYAATGGVPPIAAAISAGLFGLLGGIVAYQMGNRDKQSAFVAGVAAPGIISSIVAGVADGKSSNAEQRATLADWASMSAYAQDASDVLAPFDGAAGLKTITINTEIIGGFPTRPSLEILGTMPDGAGTTPIATLPVAPGIATISVPEGLTALVIDGETVPIDDSASVTVSISTSPTFWGDVAWGFGGNRQFEIDSVTAVPVLGGGM